MNDDHTPENPEAEVIDFATMRDRLKNGESKTLEVHKDAPKPSHGTFEFHLVDDTVTATGYLKFGPQFFAIVEGPEDDSLILFTCATHLVRYIRRLGDSGETTATLDPGN